MRSTTSFGGEVKPSIPCHKILRHVKDPLSDSIYILVGKIQRPFLAKFLSASLLGVFAATRAENSGVYIENDYNSDGEHNTSENGRSCMGRIVLYYYVTGTSTVKSRPFSCHKLVRIPNNEYSENLEKSMSC
jgi:hypothetical protein